MRDGGLETEQEVVCNQHKNYYATKRERRHDPRIGWKQTKRSLLPSLLTVSAHTGRVPMRPKSLVVMSVRMHNWLLKSRDCWLDPKMSMTSERLNHISESRCKNPIRMNRVRGHSNSLVKPQWWDSMGLSPTVSFRLCTNEKNWSHVNGHAFESTLPFGDPLNTWTL